MNAGTSPAGGTTPLPADVRQTLERRLRRETQGTALFDLASCARYATDASIYQILPVGAFVPRDERDISTAIDIARDLKVPVLARGAGTSQCGQTVGAALVIDNSKHFRRVIDIDVARRIALVQPGLVLDELNARLKPHGLWFPVDVSTSAQATLGGMAGNNSCGSRSIAYGNMVHHVLGVSAWLSDGACVDFGPVSALAGRAAQIAEFVRELAARHAQPIAERWPKLLRRVGGYNLDIFQNQSERPYTGDGSVNLAHLLVGSEGTLAYTKALTLQLSPLPLFRVLGVVNFPTFRAAMQAPQHLVKLGPSAVELIDRIMIDLGLANPSFRPLLEQALIGRPAAILLVEFSGDDAAGPQVEARRSRRSDGRSGLAGQRRRNVRCRRAEESVGSAQGRAQYHDEPQGRRQAGELHRGLCRSSGASGRIHGCAERGIRETRNSRHLVRPCIGRYAARAADPRHAPGRSPGRRAQDAGHRRGGREPGAQISRGVQRRARRRPVSRRMDRMAIWIIALYEAFRAIKRRAGPASGYSIRARSSIRRAWTIAALFRFAPPSAPRPYRTIALKPVLDWSAWNVQNDPLTEQTTAPGSGGDNTGGFAKAVEMCNNNGHCRKFDAGTMCPSFRVTRDEQHLTRGRANTLRFALSGQLGADALTSDALYEAMDLCVGCKGCKRECPTGVDMARMKIEFLAHYKARHGYTLKDQLIGRLPDYAAFLSRVPWLPNLRNTLPGAKWAGERLLGLSSKRSLPRWRSDTFWRAASASTWCERRGRACRPPRQAKRPRCCSSTRSTAHSKAKMRSPPHGSCERPAISCTRLTQARRPLLLRSNLS